MSTADGQTTYPNFSYYHAAKWGIEGFCETTAQEIAPFDVELTIIEPGADRHRVRRDARSRIRDA